MRVSTVFTFVALAATTVSGYAQKSGRDGSVIFQEMCVGCHGPDGRGDTDMGKQLKAADLTSAEVQQQSDSELSKVIKNGQKKMPAFADKLGDDEIKAVLAYVRQFGKK